jgi:hypothetical protein
MYVLKSCNIITCTSKIENKTQDEDKQNKKDNTEIQKDDQHGPHQTVGSGMGAVGSVLVIFLDFCIVFFVLFVFVLCLVLNFARAA